MKPDEEIFHRLFQKFSLKPAECFFVDDMEEKLRAGHINRLANNLCNVRSGVRYLDTLTNLERISDHAMNIAQSVINENRKAQHFHEVTE